MTKCTGARGRGQRRSVSNCGDQGVLPSERTITAWQHNFLHIAPNVLDYLGFALEGVVRVLSIFGITIVYRSSRPQPNAIDARLNLARVNAKQSSDLGTISAVARWFGNRIFTKR